MSRITTEWDTLAEVLGMLDPDEQSGDVNTATGWFALYEISDTLEASKIWTNVRFNLDENTRTMFQGLTHHRLVGHWVLRIDELGFKSLEQYDTSEDARARFQDLDLLFYREGLEVQS